MAVGLSLTLDYKKSFWLIFVLIAAQSSARPKKSLVHRAFRLPHIALGVSSGTKGLGYAD
jgi:hypothetical protein